MRIIYSHNDLGVTIRVHYQVFWARNTSDPTTNDYYEVRVNANFWAHKSNLKLSSQIQFEDTLYKHDHRDQISLMMIYDVNRESN